ncbi:hypothetical protein ACCAA_400067 [Candidatus Accumulibacter aalborgensis]|uniref:Uncharacterized protein n=1 Tax=Candidatus Accumulibacter aalborgensis TaxID=1860102 RepID=A0A1A8XPZ6_9PROT|nr:hypothetical protein ACCAA_400067 [Candidatus Accumulibacter aalborgensis]
MPIGSWFHRQLREYLSEHRLQKTIA